MTALLGSPIVLGILAVIAFVLGRKQSPQPGTPTPAPADGVALPALPIGGIKGFLLNTLLQVGAPLLQQGLSHLLKGKLPIPILDYFLKSNMQDPAKRQEIARTFGQKLQDFGQQLAGGQPVVGAAVPGTPQTP